MKRRIFTSPLFPRRFFQQNPKRKNLEGGVWDFHEGELMEKPVKPENRFTREGQIKQAFKEWHLDTYFVPPDPSVTIHQARWMGFLGGMQRRLKAGA